MLKEAAREPEGNSAASRMVSALCEMRTPCQELVMERDADRADIGARSAKRACVGKFGVGLGIATRFEDRSDRPRNRCAVAMSAAASVDRAGVETSATADAG